MYSHKGQDVWKAIGVNGESVIKRLRELAIDCVIKKKLPSEKIEMLANEFNTAELSAIIMMMEFKLAEYRHARSNEIDKSYM